MKKSIFHSAALFASLLAMANAEVNVTLSAVGRVGEASYEPSGEVIASTEQTSDQNGSPVDRALGWKWDGEVRRDIAQSFRTGASEVSLNRITLKTGGASLFRVLQDNSQAVFRLTFYRLPSATALPSSPEAELLGEQLGNFGGFAAGLPVRSGMIQNTAYSYITFTFEPVKLQPDSYYAIVLSFVKGGEGYSMPLAQNADNILTYKDGAGALLEEGGEWKACHDFYFYAEGTATEKGR